MGEKVELGNHRLALSLARPGAGHGRVVDPTHPYFPLRPVVEPDQIRS